MTGRRFVKSSDTTVTWSRSRDEVERMLRRYGAKGFSVASDYEARRIVVRFIVPDHPGPGAHDVPVQLPVDIGRVAEALYGKPKARWRSGKWMTAFTPDQMARAERVAWRHLVLWIDAALSAATAGMQTMTEAFFAHAVVNDRGVRLADYLQQVQGDLAPGVRALLESPAEEVTHPET
jgi:hypothetical protein